MILVKQPKEILVERCKRGWSLRYFSERTGMHYSTLSKIESGQARVTPRTAVGIAQALDIPFDDLFEIAIEK